MNKHITQAIAYVRTNKTWCEEEEQDALDVINEMRCGIEYADASIADTIRDLLNEYGDENGLPEDWWCEETDIDDIFFKL